MRARLRSAGVLLLVLILVTGLFYPSLVTGIGQAVFPHQANGSLLSQNGQVVGSELIGQPFGDPQYFWGRPSATQPFPYNAAASGGSNEGPLNPDLLVYFWQRAAAFEPANPTNVAPIPVDLVTASASGLDPDISVAAALYQVPRVARARGLPDDQVRALVLQHLQGRQFGVLGEPRVNVLELNLALDGMATSHQ